MPFHFISTDKYLLNVISAIQETLFKQRSAVRSLYLNVTMKSEEQLGLLLTFIDFTLNV